MRDTEMEAMRRDLDEIKKTLDEIIHDLREERTKLIAQKAALDMIAELMHESKGE